MKKNVKITPFFRWFDLWIGLYFDMKNSSIYFCYFPMLGIKFWLEDVFYCPECKFKAQKSAYDTGDGWALAWECYGKKDCIFYFDIISDIEWPFGNEMLSSKDLENRGFAIV